MLVTGIEDMCGEWTSYSLKYTGRLSQHCDTKSADEISNVFVQVGQYCGAF